MVFFKEMIGDKADVFIRVRWNSDLGKRVEKIYNLKIKFIS